MSRRIGDIEVLRAFAVLMVMFQHINGVLTAYNAPTLPWPLTHLGGGFGVDVFFVISGYVIARGLLPKLPASSTWSRSWPIIKAFWIRRFWRLIPSAWLWLAILMLLAWLFNESGAFGTVSANLDATLAGLFNVANARFAVCFKHCEFSASFVYWSLSLEEQFYLLLPLLVFLGRSALPCVLLALVLLQWVIPRDIWMMVFRTDALLLGVLLAMFGDSLSRSARPVRWLETRWVASAWLILVVGTLLYLGSPTRGEFSYEVGAAAVLSLSLVWIASWDKDLFFRSPGLRLVLLWLGSRSYAIYLIHVPVYLCIRELQYRLVGNGDTASSLYLAIALPIAWLLIGVLAEANFRFVEFPLRRVGIRLTSGARDLSTRSRPPLRAAEPTSNS
ncbi:acyltransferase family protein [Pseudomonas nitroreducens]|uniref:acyltransferase family protein n=1 Tax=Pseudomonas nitroreducens TaxID=46680 RepID=UPI003821CC7E